MSRLRLTREGVTRSPFTALPRIEWVAHLLVATGAFMLVALTIPLSAQAQNPALAPGLLESERNTIQVFRAADPAVVFVTNSALRRDQFSLNVTRVPRGTGSGFIWDRFGHVVTNFHVIADAQSLSVTLSDGTTHPARVVGAAPRKDLAVLHIETEDLDLTALPLGRSSGLVVGQKVLAIGNPFGLDRTLTTGIISALGREIQARESFMIEDVIQTDASINPGNSGGPLLDSAGRLIGVNTAIYSPSGTSAGIGFAIPVDTVARIVPQLIRFGRVKRAGLGITVMPEHITQHWNVRGVVVRLVQPDSPAEEAGIRSIQTDRRGTVRRADIIVAIDDTPVLNFGDLASALDDRSPGDRIRVTLERDGERIQVPVRLTEVGP